ncbi:hypothetical protein HMPREF0322_00748 [Desulfitobacterium hafniense DP7]|uniref:Uncharacterized protein n=1 Tax=Desulfitobacterium hafniense DP7 TaxID=537010 RepID=G9XIH2_DESHA|nr:hypothetical protein HMPREF0322_00748 [Desulfitobacterium hafniense DP7]
MILRHSLPFILFKGLSKFSYKSIKTSVAHTTIQKKLILKY